MEAYDRSTAPLIEFYRKGGLLLQVSARGTPEEIYERTIPELEVRRLTQFAEQMWAAAENRRSGLYLEFGYSAEYGLRGCPISQCCKLPPFGLTFAFPLAGQNSPFTANPSHFFGLR
jgi:hypothetical protein